MFFFLYCVFFCLFFFFIVFFFVSLSCSDSDCFVWYPYKIMHNQFLRFSSLSHFTRGVLLCEWPLLLFFKDFLFDERVNESKLYKKRRSKSSFFGYQVWIMWCGSPLLLQHQRVKAEVYLILCGLTFRTIIVLILASLHDDSQFHWLDSNLTGYLVLLTHRQLETRFLRLYSLESIVSFVLILFFE